MQIYKFETSMVSVAGTVSVNTHNIIGGMCEQIYIKGATDSTNFQVTITDDGSRVVREYDYTTHFLLDETSLIMQGIYTIQVSNGSSDQKYDVLLMLREQ